MASFFVDDALLRRLARRNAFDVPSRGMVFVGIRGAAPVRPDDHGWGRSQPLNARPLDYRHMRCAFLQWRPEDALLAAFPGSTAPNIKAIERARNGGDPANQVIPGCFSYLRGQHKAGKPRGHDAFRQNSFMPVQRSRDDSDFDLADAVDFARGSTAEHFVWDNLHAAFHSDPATEGYSSDGCQVVAGIPSTNDGQLTESGPWATFRANAYALDQDVFPYMLFEADDVEMVAASADGDIPVTLRYGSRGPLVGDLQRALGLADPDDKFGRNTLIALYEFQKRFFGPQRADCVVGPLTAKALGLRMPTLAGPAPSAPSSLGVAAAVGGPGGPVRQELGVDDVVFSVPDRFTREVVVAAMRSQARWGIPASVVLAQWALESAFGRRMPPNSNNPFGIKAGAGQNGVSAGTTEFLGGAAVALKARFRVFSSLDEAFDAHGKLLATSRFYERARQFMSDPDRFADALTGVYATDPAYGSKLRQIMRKFDLYKFNRLAEGLVDANDDQATEDAMEVIGATAKGARVESLQKMLTDLGYPLGAIDGRFGPLTAAALLSFQHDNGLPTTCVYDAATASAFDRAQPRPLPRERVAATEKDLIAKDSRVVKDARMGRVASWVTAIFGMLGIGNSAVVNGAGAGRAAAAPDQLLPLLLDVGRLTEAGRAAPAELARLSLLARELRDQILAVGTSPETAALLQQVRSVIPADVLARLPDLQRLIEARPTARPSGFSTVFDILPTFFADGTVLSGLSKAVATVGASTIPGLGGSLALLGLGLFGRSLANRIAAARVEDHNKANNIGR